MLKNDHGRSLYLRALALAFVPVLALAGCGDAVGADAASLSGTYAGSATSTTGTFIYRLVIPETDASSFPVSGTVVKNGEPLEVRGTGLYDHPHVTLELVPTGGTVEDIFGVSGRVNGSHDAIIVSIGEEDLTLSRR